MTNKFIKKTFVDCLTFSILSFISCGDTWKKKHSLKLGLWSLHIKKVMETISIFLSKPECI